MKRLPVLILSTAMLAASTLPSLAAPFSVNSDVGSQPRVIQVDDNWRHHDRNGDYRNSDWRDGDRHHHHHHGNAGAIIGGLAAGAIIGGVLAAPQRHERYYDDRQRYYDDSY